MCRAGFFQANRIDLNFSASRIYSWPFFDDHPAADRALAARGTASFSCHAPDIISLR
jgi:hypothetical protein